jgi:hypothetical protein
LVEPLEKLDRWVLVGNAMAAVDIESSASRVSIPVLSLAADRRDGGLVASVNPCPPVVTCEVGRDVVRILNIGSTWISLPQKRVVPRSDRVR